LGTLVGAIVAEVVVVVVVVVEALAPWVVAALCSL